MLVIPEAYYLSRSLDPEHHKLALGRLILDEEFLHFIHLTESTLAELKGWGSGAELGNILGQLALGDDAKDLSRAAVEAAQRIDGDAHAVGEAIDQAARGRLSVAEQVAQIHGSFSVPHQDMERRKLTLFGKLKILTARQGERHEFRIPKEHRRALKGFLSQLPALASP